MKKGHIIRFKDFKDWSLGILLVSNKFWYIAELPYRGNKRNVSSIPLGLYKCKKQDHVTTKSRYLAWELESVPGRTDIEIHIGNVPKKDSLGCILIGMDYVDEGVINSTLAYSEFMKTTQWYESLEIEVSRISCKWAERFGLIKYGRNYARP